MKKDNPMLKKALEEAARQELASLPEERQIIRPYSDKFEKDMRDEYLDSIIDDFSNGKGSDRINSQGSNSILIALFGDENLFRIEALDYKLFKSAIKWKPSYDRFYKSISKLLKVYGIKL